MKKKKKILLGFIIIFFISFLTGSISILSGERDSLSSLTNLIPNKFKSFLKKTIFVHSELKTKELELNNKKKIIEFNKNLSLVEF